MTWITEHGMDYAVPAEVTALVESGRLFDMSWHNDACPSFATVQADSDDAQQDGARVLWVEHANPDSRESDDAPRYGVTVMGDGWEIKEDAYTGNDLAEALRVLFS